MADKFETLDSGKREDFATGARRDTQEGKPRYDLIPTGPLRRLADLLARGADKYGEHNWEKGMPLSRFYASMFRHLIQWREGDRAEDHLAAILFNAMAIMHFEDAGRTDLDDIEHVSTKPPNPSRGGAVHEFIIPEGPSILYRACPCGHPALPHRILGQGPKERQLFCVKCGKRVDIDG